MSCHICGKDLKAVTCYLLFGFNFSGFDFESFFGNQPNAVSTPSGSVDEKVTDVNKSPKVDKINVAGPGRIIGLILRFQIFGHKALSLLSFFMKFYHWDKSFNVYIFAGLRWVCGLML